MKFGKFSGRQLALALACALAFGHAMAAARHDRPTMDPDGTIHLPAYALPESIYMSEQAKKTFITLNSTLADIAPGGGDVVTSLMRRLVARAKAAYPVRIEHQKIGGVATEVVVPSKAGAAEGRKVLINLHGGGGTEPPPELNELVEAIPVAAVSGFEVISVTFRFDVFPRANQDIEHVYRALLRTHEARDIGIYGCSFGGILTAQFVSWLEVRRLPLPGAIGIFCSGIDWPFGGDSAFYAWPFLGENASAPPHPNPPIYEDIPYFRGADPKSTLVSPALSRTVLSCFPPTLIVTGTRDFMLSSAVHAQALLSAAGVHVELRVWEGMWHAFFYSVDLPESREMYAATARFFAANLGRRRIIPKATGSRFCNIQG